MTVGQVVKDSRVVICTGSGGVGKTTTAAVLAIEGARQGRKSVVVTIDPAKRLADALGLADLTNDPSLIAGDWDGELWALMLDTESTFDSLVYKYAANPAQAQGILTNRFYRNIAGALSGTQEYMAAEKLYELYEEGGYDLIVVDTPPTRNAIDFVEAPARLSRFLEHRLYRLVIAPTRGVAKAMNLAAQTFLRTVSKVVGGDVIRDVTAFFTAFEGMEEGFKARARHVERLLADSGTAFLLVASPREDTVEEARYFASKLAENDLQVKALVVNRVHPRFSQETPAVLTARADQLAGTDLGDLYRCLAESDTIAVEEDGHLAHLAEQIAPAPMVKVPFLASDVHDLETLDEIRRWIT